MHCLFGIFMHKRKKEEIYYKFTLFKPQIHYTYLNFGNVYFFILCKFAFVQNIFNFRQISYLINEKPTPKSVGLNKRINYIIIISFCSMKMVTERSVALQSGQTIDFNAIIELHFVDKVKSPLYSVHTSFRRLAACKKVGPNDVPSCCSQCECGAHRVFQLN